MLTILDRDGDVADGDPLAPLWHWLYFPTTEPLSALGRDGHPRLGGFLPPVDLPRRMWAGGRFTFDRPLRVGDTVERHSTIDSVRLKQGKSGRLCFVTVRHDYHVAGEPRMAEEHDIVYREDPTPGAPSPIPPDAPADAEWTRTIDPGPVMLFRYSALTFNGHRIHYDRDYCHDVEGYPGLVFHGPLTATLLLDLALQEQPDRRIASYRFRAVSPLFDTAPFRIAGQSSGDEVALWAANSEGQLAMQAEAVFE